MYMLRLLTCFISIASICTGCTSIFEDLFSGDEELNTEELSEKYFSIAKGIEAIMNEDIEFDEDSEEQ